LSFSVGFGRKWWVTAGSAVAGECRRWRGEGGEEEKKRRKKPWEEACVRGEGEEEEEKREKKTRGTSVREG
jgi:hypothetical protein